MHVSLMQLKNDACRGNFGYEYWCRRWHLCTTT